MTKFHGTNPLEIPYEPGDTPDTETVKLQDGPHEIVRIIDGRAVLADTLLRELGGKKERDSYIYQFKANDANLENALQAVKDIPYYELDRRYTSYGKDKLKDQPGVKMFVAPKFPDNARDSQTILRAMCANKATFDKFESIVFDASRATPEAVASIEAAIDADEIDEDLLEQDTKLTIEALENKIAANEIDIPLANKISNIYTKANPREDQRQRTTLREINKAYAEGRVQDSDLDEFGVTADDLANDNLSLRTLYKLKDLAKGRASSNERAAVEQLLEWQYKPTRGMDTSNLDKLTSRSAMDFIMEKDRLLSPDEKAVIKNLRQGKAAGAAVKAAVPNEAKAEIETFKKSVGDAVFTDYRAATVSAVRVVGSNDAGIVGFTNDAENAFTEIPAAAFGASIKAAGDLAGSIVAVSGVGSDRKAEVSSQPSLDATSVQVLGLEAARRNFGGATIAETPTQGSGTCVFESATRENVAVMDGGNLYVVPKSAFATPPKSLQNVSFNSEEGAQTDVAQTNGKAAKATVAAGRGR